jgi:hypothetical protein
MLSRHQFPAHLLDCNSCNYHHYNCRTHLPEIQEEARWGKLILCKVLIEHGYPFFRKVVLGVLIFCIGSITIVQAAAQTLPLQVTVTASPAVYTPGGSCQIHVTVTYNGQPAPNIPVQFLITGSQVTISPVSGSTDTSGSLPPATQTKEI